MKIKAFNPRIAITSYINMNKLLQASQNFPNNLVKTRTRYR